MIPFVKVHGTTNFQGYVKNRANNAINSASVVLADCYFNVLGFDSTDSSGYYSFDVTLNSNSPYYLSAGKDGFDSDTKEVSGGGTNNFILNGPIKIAVFFWATDAGQETFIDDYIDILQLEGYEKFYKFEDSTNVESHCQTVDNFEYEDDTIFVYIIGHGYYTDSHSFTAFKAENCSQVYSNTFRGYMDDWEAEKKCLLVESCQSGGWADDFASSPYLAMSTSDDYFYSHTYNNHSTPYEGDFSHEFFYAIYILGDNAEDAFDYACDEIDYIQNPQIEDHSSYVWFDD